MWFTNGLLPEISEKLQFPNIVNEGWLIGMAEQLTTVSDKLSLVICCPQNLIKQTQYGNLDDKYRYYAYFKKDKDHYDKELKNKFINIIEQEKPDVIHIMGTEYPHSYSVIEAAQSIGCISRCVISIQGLVSVYSEHYNLQIPNRILNSLTLRDILKRSNLRKDQILFRTKGEYEIQAIQKCNNIIGRTHWDRHCTYLINRNRHYYFNNETLRPAFYKAKWSIEKCEKYSIFASQATYPIKGFHQILKAFSYVYRYFPQAKLYVAGSGNLIKKQKTPIWKRTTYENYLFYLMDEFGIKDNVIFCGNLDEKSMVERYLKSHVFVSASSIENSPNSVGEAMLLGVPTVASFVGGTNDLLVDGKEGYLYSFNEPYSLAGFIMDIFRDNDLANDFSKRARHHALETHNGEKNAKDLYEIYQDIVKDKV